MNYYHRRVVCITAIILTDAESEFILSPVSQVIPSGLQQAIFYCIHSTAESIGWRVDYVPLGRVHHMYMGISTCTNRRRDGVIINRLKVDADQEYDGLVVECVALFGDRPPNISQPANLTIEGTLDHIYYHKFVYF